MKKKDFLVGLMMFAQVAVLQASDADEEPANQITERAMVRPPHQTCLSIQDDEDYVYAERNVAFFYVINRNNINALYERGVINPKVRNEPSAEDEKALKTILGSETNVAYDVCRHPQALKKDLMILGEVIFSSDKPYTMRSNDSFSDVTELKKVLILLNELCSFVEPRRG